MKDLHVEILDMTSVKLDEITVQDYPISEKPKWEAEAELAENLQPDYKNKIKVRIKNSPVDRP